MCKNIEYFTFEAEKATFATQIVFFESVFALLNIVQFISLTDPPHIWTEPMDSNEVNEGQPATLICRWSSNPSNLTDLQFTFTPDPKLQSPFPLSSSGLFQRNARVLRLSNSAAQLAMMTTSRNQSGYYGCIAANAFGRSSTSIATYLAVLCKYFIMFFKFKLHHIM